MAKSDISAAPAVRTERVTTFAALRFRNFRLWFLGQTLSLMGTWMQSVAQGWLVYELTKSEFALGAVSFIGTLPTLVLMLPGGVLADRVPRRRLLMVTQATMMVLAFILAALAARRGLLQVWHIGLLAVGLGVANSFDAPARQSLSVEMVEDRRYLTNAIALNSTIFNLARVVGPAIGGAVLAGLGAAWCFALNGLSFVAVLFALGRMQLPKAPPQIRTAPLMQQTAEGLKYVKSNRAVFWMLAILGVASTFAVSYSVLLPAFADVLGVGKVGLGALNVAVGMGALAGSLVVASLGAYRYKARLMTFGSIILPVAVIVFGVSRSFSLSLAALAVVGLGIVTQNALVNTLIQMVVPDHLRGRVMAVYTLMFFGTAPFGSLQIGAVAQWLGPGGSVVISGIITLAFALYVAIAIPEVRELQVG